jgi:hypothetical protein
MLMKWSRPGATASGAAGAGVGGYSPRTLSRKQLELKQLQQDKKLTTSELRMELLITTRVVSCAFASAERPLHR